MLRLHLFFSAYSWYILSRSPANIAASSPPVPALISSIMFFSSFGSFGINKTLSFFSSFSFFSVRASSSFLAISLNSSSFSVSRISFASLIPFNVNLYRLNSSTIFPRDLYSLFNFLNKVMSDTVSGFDNSSSTSKYLLLSSSSLSIIYKTNIKTYH